MNIPRFRTRGLYFLLFTCSFFGIEPTPFEQWEQKKFELMALFLPPDPAILCLGEKNFQISAAYPRSTRISFPFKPTTPIDLFCLDLDLNLQIPLEIPSTVTCIYIHMSDGSLSSLFSNVENAIKKSGFIILTDWHTKGEKAVIFVKQTYFYNQKINRFLQTHKVTHQKYRVYYEPFFKVYYYLEDETDDSLKNILKQGLPYEGNIGIIIDYLIQEGSLAVDVGAHIGSHTIPMARKTGAQGAVLAFEPDKVSYMELLKNLSVNSCNNVIPICKALGALPKTTFLSKHKIEEQDTDATGDLVETIALDSLNLNNLSLIKMDIENYEYFALQGARETILRNKPIIVFECWIGKDYLNSPPKEKINFDRVISLIKSYGYEIYVIYCNDFIAFPLDGSNDPTNYKKNFKKLDLNNFDLGL